MRTFRSEMTLFLELGTGLILKSFLSVKIIIKSTEFYFVVIKNHVEFFMLSTRSMY